MKILSNILYGIFVTLLVGVALLFLASLLPIPGNIELKIVKSGSMEPTIMTGAIVVIKPESAYTVGDIVTFGEDSKGEIPTTHRIVSMREASGQTFYSTKGDANEDPDPMETPKNEVIGKVIFDMPYAGYVLDFARKPIGFTLMIGVPALIIIFDELAHIVKEVREIRRRKRERFDPQQTDI
jgi:signal peptidase